MPTSHRDAHPYGRSADDVRRRDQRLRRTRRLRATQLGMFSVLAVALIGIGVYAVGELQEPSAEPGVISPKSLGPDPMQVQCPDPEATPLEPGEVTVTVLNGTTRSGLAGTTAEELGERGYEVADVGNTRSAGAPVAIVYGPAGYLAAMSVNAQLASADQEPVLKLSEDREGAAVDLLLGTGYRGLAEESEASATLQEAAPAPEGC